MEEATVRAALERHWELAGTDQEGAHELYHDDAVLEFPQSQERYEGKANFLAWRRIYPASVRFRIRRIRGSGGLWVAEVSVSYSEGPWLCACSILEFRHGKVIRETIYIGDGWQAPDWRAQWRAPWRAESAG